MSLLTQYGTGYPLPCCTLPHPVPKPLQPINQGRKAGWLLTSLHNCSCLPHERLILLIKGKGGQVGVLHMPRPVVAQVCCHASPGSGVRRPCGYIVHNLTLVVHMHMMGTNANRLMRDTCNLTDQATPGLLPTGPWLNARAPGYTLHKPSPAANGLMHAGLIDGISNLQVLFCITKAMHWQTPPTGPHLGRAHASAPRAGCT